MQLLSKGHCDGHPLMLQHGAETSLSASLGSRSILQVTQTKREGALGINALLLPSPAMTKTFTTSRDL